MGKMIRLAVALLAVPLLAPRAEAQAQAPAAAAKPSPLKPAAKEYSFEIRPTIGLVIPLRAEREDEAGGLDQSEHGEEAYVHTGGVTAT